MPFVAHEPLSDDARADLIGDWGESWRRGGDVVYGAFHGGVVVGGCGLHHRAGPGRTRSRSTIGFTLIISDAAMPGKSPPS